MKLYVSGPMTGVPNHNYPLFERVTHALRVVGHEVVSPHEADLEEDLPHGESEDGLSVSDEEYEELLSRDHRIIAEGDFDGIVFLPGWQESGGAGREGRMMFSAGGRAYIWAPWRPGYALLDRLRWDHFQEGSVVKRAASVA